MDELLIALKKYFNYDTFLDFQQEIVSRMLSGQDLCVIMPTGAGKSLCYQLPLLMRPGYGIVVSPLISLMKDQVDALNQRGIPAGGINSSVPFGEQQRILSDCAAGDIKILYVAPERFGMEAFCRFLRENPPSALVVDEAHCISQWGHDFRPSYLQIGNVAGNFNIPQVCAFTATATPLVRRDIKAQLKRPDMQVQVSGFKRPNLAFRVCTVTDTADKLKRIRELLKEAEPTIIYASTRKAVDELTAELGCLAYHAGMSDAARAASQDAFMHDSAPVLVATNAFGMGIDRPDVRRIIHYNMPGTLEAYYQEAGRAGRDGEPAECVLLFSYSDRYIQEFLIDMNNPGERLVRQSWQALKKLAEYRQTSELDLRLSEIIELVPEAKNERQISSALQTLEAKGFISRNYNSAAVGRLRFIGRLGELKVIHQEQKTQRSRFIYRMIAAYQADSATGIDISWGEMTTVANLNLEQIKRVLAALQHDGVLEWEPPFSGRGIKLADPLPEIADIDFEEVNAKRDFEVERLDDVIKYTKFSGCRQKFLVEYFGEDASDWECGNCDHCNADAAGLRPPTEAEITAIKIILGAAYHFNMRLGMGTVSQILGGCKNANLVNRNLTGSKYFGVLRHLKQNQIMQLMRALEAAGMIVVDRSREYPLLRITDSGCQYNGSQNIKLNFAPAVEKPGKTTAKTASAADDLSEDGDLLSLLRSARTQLATIRHLPPYQIATNEVLAQLAKVKPLTCDECLSISGVGPVKARSVMPHLLKVIDKWREKQK